MENKLHLTFWGGVGTVTGANFLLESTQTRLLVDCGLLQGIADAVSTNASSFPYDPKSIDFLFVTHAHMDHIGRIPKLVRDGFRGVIYSTPETREIAHLMLLDALKVMQMNIQKMSGEGHVSPEKLLYEKADLDQAFFLWQGIPYHVEIPIGSDFSVYLKDAGHILGSSMYEFTYAGKKIMFTGDSGNSPTPLLRDTESVKGVQYLIMDSVYGDRNHESKEERDAKFQRIVSETIVAGGALVIPAFSLERTQVILYELNNLVEEGKIPSVPVFLDSPLAEKVTEIYRHTSKYFNAEVQNEIKGGDDIFSFPKLTITHGRADSEEIIATPNPKIILAGSGMSSGGRIIQHEIHFLPDSKSTLLLMGYQAVGTLGREIQDMPKEIEIEGQNVPVHARIEMISGYSSHKDSDHLIAMAEQAKGTLKKVFVVMGEPKASIFLAQRLKDYAELDAVCPERGVVYELEV